MAFASLYGHENLCAVQAVVVLRTLLQDRIAMLNGRSVEHVLKQDVGAFKRLIALSAVQVSSLSKHGP